nr:ribonuclease H-like domain-containing protein [Tanacetum cinerariifolium]
MAIGDPSGSAVDLISNLDAGNPLCLQNNDSSSLVIVNVKLGAENYKMWETAMKSALKGKNKIGFIDVYFEIAFEVWTELKETYDKMDRISYTCDAKSRSAMHTQLIRFMQFLMGLNDVYQPIRSTILAMDPLPNVKDAFYVVSREESHRGLFLVTMVFDTLAFILVDLSVPSTSGSLSSSFTNEQMFKLLSLINEKPSPSANMLVTLGWIIDSDANQHMIDSVKDMFNVVDIYSLMLIVCQPNGTLAKNFAIGSLRLSCLMRLLFLSIM